MEACLNILNSVGVFLQGLGTILGAAAVIVAAVLGASNLKKWREQKITDRKIDLAERIVIASYNARRDLVSVRNAFIAARELLEAEKELVNSAEGLSEVGEVRKNIITQQAYYRRLNAAYDNRRELLNCQPMARALFSEKLEKALETLGGQFNLVAIYVDHLPNINRTDDPAFRKLVHRTVTTGGDDNEVDQTVAAQIQIIEDICLPVLRLADRSA